MVVSENALGMLVLFVNHWDAFNGHLPEDPGS